MLNILSQLPLAGLLIPIGLVLVVLFMCTSADSMSYAAAMVVSGRNEPPLSAPVLGLDDRQPHPGAAADRHGPGRQHLHRCPAGLHRDHRVPVTPLVLATLWSAPRLAWKEARREGLS